MTKTTRRKTKTAKPRTAKLPAVPIGLSLLLSLIEDSNKDEAIYKRAKEIIRDRGEWREYTIGYSRPEESTQLVYPGLDEPVDSSSLFRAGVLIGAAVGWLLTQEIAGGAR